MPGKFKQAPPDEQKAADQGVATYIPRRGGPAMDVQCTWTHDGERCESRAAWQANVNGRREMLCDEDKATQSAEAQIFELIRRLPV